MSDAVATDRDQAAPEPMHGRPRREGKRRRLGMAGVTALTAALALVSGVVALLFDLVPALKPDPRERLGAEVSIFDVEPGVTIGDWLKRTNQREQLRQIGRRGGGGLTVKGNLVYVKTTIEGFKRRRASLGWWVYRTRTRTRLQEPQFYDRRAVEVRLDAPTDRSLQEVWIPEMPPLPGSFFVRVELRDANDVLLAVADSKPFRF